MKIIIPLALALALFQSCGNRADKPASDPVVTPPAEKPVAVKQSFFPVTSYFKGQLFDITRKGINPIKYTTVNGHTDSVWLKITDLNKAVAGFLSPEIDSTNLTSLFTEKQFMDQTLNALTFTYDPIGILPDTMALKHWDVYVEPKTGTIRRIYMVKETKDGKTIQLTWQGDKWCKTTVVINKPDGSFDVEREEKITWDF